MPLLVGISTLNLQPLPLAVLPMTLVIGKVPSGVTLDKNVEMNEPHDSKDMSHIMETDNS